MIQIHSEAECPSPISCLNKAKHNLFHEAWAPHEPVGCNEEKIDSCIFPPAVLSLPCYITLFFSSVVQPEQQQKFILNSKKHCKNCLGSEGK